MKGMSTAHYISLFADDIESPLTDIENRESYRKERLSWEQMRPISVIHRLEMLSNANLIGSLVVYKRKAHGTPKARIVPWGHRDADKSYLRKDAPCMNVEIFRMVFSISTEFKWKTCEMDLKTAFLQAKGFEREVYVRPPKEERADGYILKIEKDAYGLSNSARLWYLTSDVVHIEKFGLKKQI